MIPTPTGLGPPTRVQPRRPPASRTTTGLLGRHPPWTRATAQRRVHPGRRRPEAPQPTGAPTRDRPTAFPPITAASDRPGLRSP